MNNLMTSNLYQQTLTKLLAHDLKSPIYNLELGMQMLKNEEPQIANKDVIKSLSLAIEQTKEMTQKLVTTLLNKEECSNSKITHIYEFSENIFHAHKISAQRKNIRINTQISINGLFAVFNEQVASSALHNLLSNAIKFAPMNSKIEIIIEKNKHNLQFSVKDQGDQLSSKLRRRVFTKFSKLDSKTINSDEVSNKIGLSLTKQIIEKNGGILGFKATKPNGSCFYFTLPCSKKINKAYLRPVTEAIAA